MLRLMLSCDVSNADHLESKLALLKESAIDKYPIGIEIYEHWHNIFNPDMAQQICRNVSDLPKDVYLSFHAPFTNRNGKWKQNFFSSDEGFKNLARVLNLAEDLNVSMVNLHASLLHSYSELKEINGDRLEIYRQGFLEDVANKLDVAYGIFGKKICVESMPYDWGQEYIRDPLDMIYDVCFAETEDFLKIVDPKKNIFATIDTAHSASFYDSSEMLWETKKLQNGLGHVHLSDLGGIWKPFLNLAKEGLIPGNGRIGERVFRELLSYFLEFSKSQDLSIVIETFDSDSRELNETREALDKTIKWLQETETKQINA